MRDLAPRRIEPPGSEFHSGWVPARTRNVSIHDNEAGYRDQGGFAIPVQALANEFMEGTRLDRA